MFTNTDNPGVALGTPYILIKLDRVLLMQPICSIDLVHMIIDRNTKRYACTQEIHTSYMGRAHARCVYFVCICIDICIFVYIHVYLVYRANGVH